MTYPLPSPGASFGRAFTRATPKGSFAITTRVTPRRRAHLVVETVAAWQFGRFDGLRASTRCDRRLISVDIHKEVPDEIELCDDCALKDFPGVASVYRFFDRSGRLLYVGCTKNLITRLRGHGFGERPSPWWPLVSNWTYEPFGDHAEALAAEARAIVSEHPLFNTDLTDRAKLPGRRRAANLHLLAAHAGAA